MLKELIKSQVQFISPVAAKGIYLLPKYRKLSYEDKLGVMGRVMGFMVRSSQVETSDVEVDNVIGNQQVRYRLDLAEPIQCRYYFGVRNLDLVELISSRKREGIMIDAGANFGFYTCLSALYFDDVYAFEPTQNTFETLSMNVKENAFTNVHLYNVALGENAGKATLQCDEKSNALNRIVMGNDEGSYEVSVLTLDDVIPDKEKVAFIKLDVEGFEAPILRGAQQILRVHKPLVYAETWGDEDFEKIMDALPSGYEAWCPIMKKSITSRTGDDALFATSRPW